MQRFSKGAILPVPPVVKQRDALNPDGSVDTAATTDCGEACLSSILEVATSFHVSPGCIRESLGLPMYDGRTTAVELVSFLNAMGVESWRVREASPGAWDLLAALRHSGRFVVVLGRWETFDALHWVVAYQRTSQTVWYMDPWSGTHAELGRVHFDGRFEGDMVIAKLTS